MSIIMGEMAGTCKDINEKPPRPILTDWGYSRLEKIATGIYTNNKYICFQLKDKTSYYLITSLHTSFINQSINNGVSEQGAQEFPDEIENLYTFAQQNDNCIIIEIDPSQYEAFTSKTQGLEARPYLKPEAFPYTENEAVVFISLVTQVGNIVRTAFTTRRYPDLISVVWERSPIIIKKIVPIVSALQKIQRASRENNLRSDLIAEQFTLFDISWSEFVAYVAHYKQDGFVEPAKSKSKDIANIEPTHLINLSSEDYLKGIIPYIEDVKFGLYLPYQTEARALFNNLILRVSNILDTDIKEMPFISAKFNSAVEEIAEKTSGDIESMWPQLTSSMKREIVDDLTHTLHLLGYKVISELIVQLGHDLELYMPSYSPSKVKLIKTALTIAAIKKIIEKYKPETQE